MGTTFVAPPQLVDEVVRRLEASASGHASPIGRPRRLARLRGRPTEADGWSNRNAFAVHTNSVASALRVNVVGREPEGRIRPEAYDEYCRGLAAGFAALTDPATGRRLVSEVLGVADRYPGPAASGYADLLVVWDTAAPIAAVASDALGIVEAAPAAWPPGNHRPGGWLVAAGPGITPRGKIPNLSEERHRTGAATRTGNALLHLASSGSQSSTSTSHDR